MKRILCITAVLLLTMVLMTSCFLFEKEHVHTPSEVVIENEVSATCTEDGSYDEVTYCTDPECGAELSRVPGVIEATGHEVNPSKVKEENRVEPTCTEKGSYDEVIYCQDPACGAEISRKSKSIDAKGHSYVEEIVSVHVPETEGEIRYVCSDCEDTYYEYDKHDYTYNTEIVPPTCYRDGYTEHTCVCGDYYRDEHVDMLPHNVTDFSNSEVWNGTWVKEVVFENSCLCDRVLHFYPICQNEDCGAHLKDSYGAFTDTTPDHTYGEWRQIENTDYTSPCEQDEVWIQECVYCHCYECAKIKTQPAPGHVWSRWSMVVAPTTESAGEYARYCTVCVQPINGASVVAETVEIPHLNKYDYTYRVLVAPTAETTGKATYTLKNTPAIVVVVELPVDTSGHDAAPDIEDCTPVVGEEGTYYSYFCKHCEEWIVVDFVPADPAPHVHRYSDWFISVKPTAETTGEAIRVCEDCAQAKRGYKTVIESIELPVISEDNYKIVVLPETCERDGMLVYTYYYTKELTIELTVKIPARGHVFTELNEEAIENGSWYTYLDGDEHACICLNDRIYVPVCQDCHAYLDDSRYTVVEEATGHDYDPDGWQKKDLIGSPCYWANTWVNECTKCHHFDHAEIDVRDEAPGHVWGEWEVTKNPEHYERGEARRVCTVCELDEYGGNKVYDTIRLPWLNEVDYTYAEQVAATIDSTGKATFTYDLYPSIVIEYTIPKVHVHDIAPVLNSCVRKQNGEYYYYIYKCDQCNEWVVADIRPVNPDPHYIKWGEWTITEIPGTYSVGEATRYCTCYKCSAEGAYKERETIELPGLNSYLYYVETTPAGCTYAGGILYHYTHIDGTVATVIIRIDAFGHSVPEFNNQNIDAGKWIFVADEEHLCTCENLDYYYPICETCGDELDFEEFRLYLYTDDHEYDPNGWTMVKNPGSPCEWEELWINYCIHCNHDEHAITEVRNPAPGHNWSDWSIVTLPTDDSEGEAIRTCLDCALPEYSSKLVENRIILPALNSDEYVTNEIAPDCVTPGVRSYSYTCPDNTLIEFDITLDELGHNTTDFSLDEVDAGRWIMIPWEPSQCPCEVELSYFPVCQDCGAELIENIHVEPVRGHSYDPDGWQKAEYDPDESPCFREDIWVNECTYCGHNDCAASEIRNPAPGHNWSDWSIVTLPTDDSEGEAIRTCLDCALPEYNSTIVVDVLVLPALNTNDYSYNLYIKPDYEKTGKATYTYNADPSIVIEVDVPTLTHDVPPAKEDCIKQTIDNQNIYIYFCHECNKYVIGYIEDII